MTNLEKPVERRTAFKGRGDRPIIARMSAQGITLRLERTQDRFQVSWDTLWRWVQQSLPASHK